MKNFSKIINHEILNIHIIIYIYNFNFCNLCYKKIINFINNIKYTYILCFSIKNSFKFYKCNYIFVFPFLFLLNNSYAQNIPPTAPCSPLGWGITPQGWVDYSGTPDCSDTTKWANSHDWDNGPVPAVPTGDLTFTTLLGDQPGGWIEAIKTSMTGLVRGRKYKINFYVLPWSIATQSAVACPQVKIEIPSESKIINLEDKRIWSHQYFEFTAENESEDLIITALGNSRCLVNFALGVSLINIIKTANLEGSSAGDIVNFSISLQNTGVDNLTNVSIKDDLLERSDGTKLVLASGPAFVSNSGNSSEGTLVPMEIATFTATYKLTQQDVDARSINNQAFGVGTSSSIGEVSSYSRASAGGNEAPTVVTIPRNPKISLTKTGVVVDTNGNGVTDVGDRVNYTFTIKNTGNVLLSNIKVTDAGLQGGAQTIASLAAGASDATTISGYRVLTQTDINAGEIRNTATVTGTAPGNTNVTDTGSATVTLDAVHQLQLEKVGTHQDANSNGAFDVGEKINYTFTLTNKSNVTVTDMVLTDVKAVVGGSTVSSLAPGATNTSSLTASYTLTQPDVDRGRVDNTAQIKGKAPDGSEISDDASVRVTGTGIEKISLEKSGTHVDANSNGLADVGEKINYTFTVKNTGNVTLSAVTVTDPNVTVSGGPVATLAVGASDSTTFTASHTLTQGDLDKGEVSNTATAKSKAPGGGDVSDEGETTTLLRTSKKILLTKAATYKDTNGNGVADVGDHIDYTFTVENGGNVTLKSVKVTDTKVTVSGGPIATFAPGGKDTTTFTARHALTQADIDTGKVDNQAKVSSAALDDELVEDTSNVSTQLVRRAAVGLVKTGAHQDKNSNGVADVGEEVTFAFTVKNTGNVTLTNVKVEDAGVVLTGAPIASLAPGASNSTAYTAKHVLTQANIDEGSFSNNAKVTGSPAGLTDVTGNASVSVSIPTSAAIGLVKTGTYKDTNGNKIVDVGDTIAYSFAVQNTGNVTLSGVTISDPKATVTGGPLASLGAGVKDTTTFTALYPITQTDIDAGKVDNSAKVEGTQPGNSGTGTPVAASSDVSVPLERKPAISLIKTGAYTDKNGNNVADPGDTITYSFTVENKGNVTLRDIKVKDPKVTVLGGPLASLAVAAKDTATFTALYTITQDDVDKGGVLNEATASGKGPDGKELTASSGNVTVALESKPDVEFIKTAKLNDTNKNGLADVDETISYSFTVKNTGNVTLKDLTVSDALVTVSGGPLASLEPGESDSTAFTALYKVTQADVDSGEVRNSAVLKAKGPDGGDLEWSSRHPEGTGPTILEIELKPDIALELTAVLLDANGNGIANVGESVTYHFTVKNTGNTTLKDISMASFSVLEDGASTARVVAVSGGPLLSLLPGKSDTVSFTASYVLTQADIDAGGITGAAKVMGKGPDDKEVSALSDDPSNTSNVDTDNDGKPDDPTRIPLEQRALLELEKSGAFQWSPGDVLEAGAPILYTFKVTNAGNVSLTAVVPEDSGPSFGGKRSAGRLSGYTPSGADLAPGASQTFTATYLLTDTDIANARNIEDAVKNTARAKGRGPKGGAAVSSESTAVLSLPGYAISKMTPLSEVRRGARVPYTVRVRLLGIPQPTTVTVVDQIPQGFSLLPGSTTLDGSPVAAKMDGRRISFEGVELQPDAAVEIGLVLSVTAAAKPDEYVNRAWVEDQSGNVVSFVARAVVEVVVEAVFDCGDILGKVFDDKNRNGYQDAGEPGLPGVRVATGKGRLITSDEHGRFHVACAELPDQQIGTNYILKLDPRSLPSGYRITTENPRVVRLTAGKASEFSFGASIGRVVRLDLADEAFENRMVEFKPEWRERVSQLIALLDQEPSVLRLSYYGTDSRSKLVARRLKAVRSYIAEEWRRGGGRYMLDIEIRVETPRSTGPSSVYR